MPVVLENPEHDSEPSPKPAALPDASVLEDKTPEWCRMSAPATGFLFGLGLILVVLFANRPLWHSDLWDHINYGQYTIDSGSIPNTEPLLPLAEGMPWVQTAWLSQVSMAKTLSIKNLGLPALQFGHGLLVIASLTAVGLAIVRKSHSVLFAMIGYLVFLAVNWHQFLIIRPQTVGVVFYAILICVLTTNTIRRRFVWFVLPMMFNVWANSHGSFAMGLAMMAVYAAGRVADIWLQTKSLKLAINNQTSIRLVLLTQLCAIAALVNPVGLEIYAEVLRVGRHPNITSMFEWAPLTLRMQQGQMTAAACVLLFLLLQASPRRLRIDELAALLVTGGMALWSARMLNWFAPIVAISIGVHGAAVWRMLRNVKLPQPPANRSGLWTVVSLGLCWIFFGFTALGTQTIHGKTPDVRRSVSRSTPVETGRFLSEHAELPPGIAFVPAEWAGYLMHVGPPRFAPMVNLHVHVISAEVWNDYLRILNGSSDWDGLLDRYGINLLVVDASRQTVLLRLLRNSDEFVSRYEDNQSVVFERKEAVR